MQAGSPIGSHENLRSPQSPDEDSHRKNSLLSDIALSSRRISSANEGEEHKQSTTEVFKDIFSQKRSMILSKLTSFDSDVSIWLNAAFICKFY